MRAAVFVGDGVLELQDREPPSVKKSDEVLLKVEGCGICGTDLHILEVPPGHPATPGVILGHEYIGRVLETGPEVTSLTAGDRVAVAPNISCGRCRFCRSGLSNHCSDFTTLGIFRDGGLALFNVAPEQSCFPLSDEVAFEDAIWTELLSCVMNSVDNVKIQPGETAVIMGGGSVGALHALLFLASGARVVVCDILSERLKLLHQLGVTHTIDIRNENLKKGAQQIAPVGADVVVDAVGTEFEACIDLARPGARISLFGMNSKAKPPVSQNNITRKELTVYGSYIGTHTFPRAIEILESGAIHPSQLISIISPLDEILETVEGLRAGAYLKAVIQH